LTYDAGVTAPTRETLTRVRIIEAAVAFADEHGIEALSMRKLGAELDVEAMSLYNHVANKDDIHDGMVDYVFGSIALPEPGEDWKVATRRIGMGALEAFTAHIWIVNLLDARAHLGLAALRFTDAVMGVFADAGFSDEDINHAWQLLASHTMGYAFQQATSQSDNSEMADKLALLTEEFPNVARLAPILAYAANTARNSRSVSTSSSTVSTRN